MADIDAVGAQLDDEIAHAREGGFKGRQRRDLRTDVHSHADRVDARQRLGLAVQRGRQFPFDAELVFLTARRDFIEAAGVHIRIDAQGDARRFSHLRRDAAECEQFGFGLNVELSDVVRQRKAQLGFGFADAGEDNLFGRAAGA